MDNYIEAIFDKIIKGKNENKIDPQQLSKIFMDK